MDLNMPTPRKPIGARHKSRPHAHAKCKTKEEALARLQEIKSSLQALKSQASRMRANGEATYHNRVGDLYMEQSELEYKFDL
jgi:hypothetical protein